MGELVHYQVLYPTGENFPVAYTEPRDTYAAAQKDLRAALADGHRGAFIASSTHKTAGFWKNPPGHALVDYSRPSGDSYASGSSVNG